ncbi:predicted protein [Sclerotinia sclerotiorum 1980 UF-70]|uniref:Uncharacterized protein n=1 Tax=Sclerotinia sclerotiorum (strain ATCC 18683 / 1980 / Ss-1) TaxID=665079 RepID=A7EZ78_SCLS1|nr:predicted protein [Sclerotinia sclerotiorum 1980 UF-70]EDN94770.1 predicted protein [Sclerotinia sclerotiorum 1980 UF-70]
MDHVFIHTRSQAHSPPASALSLHSTQFRPRALTIDVTQCSGASMLILVEEFIIMTCLRGSARRTIGNSK